MAITFGVATSSGTNTADGRGGDGTFTATLPSGWSSGELGIIVCYLDQGTASINESWSTCPGAPWGTNTPKLYVFYKFLGSSETDPTITISGSSGTLQSLAACATFAGVDTKIPIEVTGTATSSTGTPNTATSTATATPGAWALGICGRGDNEAYSGQTFGGSSTGVTERLDSGTQGADDGQVCIYSKEFADIGTTGAGSATTSATDPYVSVIIVLRAAGALDRPIQIVKPTPWTPLRLDHTLAHKLSGVWLFNENGGETVYDFFSPANNGSLGGGSANPTWVSSPLGPALLFDGSDDKITISKAIVTGSPITVCAWARLDQHIDAQAVLVSIADTATNNYCYELSVREFKQAAWGARNTSTYSAYSTKAAALGVWHFFTGIEYSSSSRAAFIDGQYKGTETTNITPSGLDTTAFGVRKRDTESQFWKGAIACVLIYRRALSDSEVMQLYVDTFAMFKRPNRSRYFYTEPPAMALVPILMRSYRTRRN